MSAYLSTPEHIGQIVAHSMKPDGLRVTAASRAVGGDSIHEKDAAEILARENFRSVAHRYQDSDPARDFLGSTLEEYLADSKEATTWIDSSLSPVDIIKMIHGYRYQSCECENWTTTDAKIIADRFEWEQIQKLPGFDRGPWSYDGEHATRAVSVLSMMENRT